MEEVLTTLVILVGLGVFFATIIAIAYKKLKVEEDPRIDRIEEMLPSANCGACGEPGCRAFAERIVRKEVNPGKCTVSSAEGVESIASFMGIEVSRETKKVARLLCAGGKNEAHNLSEYKGGLATCRGEAVVDGGPKACFWGCLGLGDCAEVCDFDAIKMNEDGLPLVDPEKCTACNDCVEVCPKNLFELMPVTQHLIVQCKSLLEGELAESKCSVACTACSRCVADSAPNVISIENNLAVINYDLNNLTSPMAVQRCPTGAIVWLDEEKQFVPSHETELPTGRVETLIDLKNIYYQ